MKDFLVENVNCRDGIERLHAAVDAIFKSFLWRYERWRHPSLGWIHLCMHTELMLAPCSVE